MTDARILTGDGPTKRCPKCREDFPATTEFFWGDRGAADGLYYCCKGCWSELPSARRRLALRAMAKERMRRRRLGLPLAE